MMPSRTKGLPQTSDHSAPPARPPPRRDDSTVATADIPPPPSLSTTTRLRPVAPGSLSSADPPVVSNSGASSQRISEGGVVPPQRQDSADNRFQVKAFMAALGTQENANVLLQGGGESQTLPGAVPVPGIGQVENDTVMDNIAQPSNRNLLSDDSSYYASSSDPPTSTPSIVAHLAPSEADFEARIAERLEQQITEKLEERLMQRRLEQTAEGVAAEVGTPSSIKPNETIVIAEPMDDSKVCCGLRKKTACILAILLLCIAGGTAGGVLYALGGDEDDGADGTEFDESSREILTLNPAEDSMTTLAPSISPIMITTSPQLPTLPPSTLTITSAPSSNNDGDDESDPEDTNDGVTETNEPTRKPTIATTKSPTKAPTKSPTDSPTKLPTRSPVAPRDPLLEELKEWIAPTANDLLPFDEVSSSVARALSWLKNDPITLTAGRSTETVVERYALAVLYYSTVGANWLTDDFGFLSDADVCEWNNGLDFFVENALGIYCVDDGVTVDGIVLNDNNLRGRLPWQLTLLSNLISMDFDGNRIGGPIPRRYSQLSLLETLWASGNALTGTLPNDLPSRLDSIDLGDNNLSGSLPSSWSEMSNITYIALIFNRLTGSLPTSWQSLTSLQTLDLEGNSLDGLIPSGYGALTNLEFLYLEKNSFTGTLPTTFGRLGNLIDFQIYENNLSGTIPRQLGDITPLEFFSFADNDFTGSVDSFFCGGFQWSFLEADCDEVDCPCCTSCCYDGQTFCDAF